MNFIPAPRGNKNPYGRQYIRTLSADEPAANQRKSNPVAFRKKSNPQKLRELAADIGGTPADETAGQGTAGTDIDSVVIEFGPSHTSQEIQRTLEELKVDRKAAWLQHCLYYLRGSGMGRGRKGLRTLIAGVRAPHSRH
ncbi:hypothetical protein WJX75_001701 [Coccomyxa subellipsoidea]|uniref:Uncharacterized protein n=1 Tax=Coccomyxa subellipsoidea TaxID=248742 RepID=A0ABR2YP93_9CHLO